MLSIASALWLDAAQASWLFSGIEVLLLCHISSFGNTFPLAVLVPAQGNM